MTRIIGDSEVQSLISEPKPLPHNWRKRLTLRQQRAGESHQRAQLELQSDSKNSYRISLRQNGINLFDFSVILTFIDVDGGEYRLTRFNGRHPSQHTNGLEKRAGNQRCSFRNRFHKHIATERYQLAEGFEIDHYAEVTDEYDSFDKALTRFLQACGFYAESDRNRPLPPREGGEAS